MSLYEKAILNCLKDGPKQRKDIIKQLCPKIMSEKKLQVTLNELDDAGRVKTVSRKAEGSHRQTTWYALPEHQYLLETDAGRVAAAIERLKSILMRSPLVHEIAVEAGITPETAEKWAYTLAPQTGWFDPAPESIRESTTKLGELLYCEALMKSGKVRENGESDNFSYNDDIQIVEQAKRLRYQKEYPTIFAVINADGKFVSWSPEAEKYLRGYKPKDRYHDFLSMIRFG